MSLYDYQQSHEIATKDYPFYALIMAAMRQADTDNAELLKRTWPHVWDELRKRYWAAGGKLAEDEIGDPPSTQVIGGLPTRRPKDEE